MRNLLRNVACTAVPLAFIAGCSGGSGSLPSSPGTTTQSVLAITPNDNGVTSLHAAGATFPAIAYNGESQPVGLATSTQPGPAPGSIFATYHGTGTIYYCLTGSGFGKGIFIGASAAASTQACAPLGQTPTGAGGRVDPLDFVGTDAALKSTEYQTYATSRKATNGEPFEAPVIGGPIVFGYTQSDYPGLGTAKARLSRWSYCAIANGTITDWNDPAITQDNGHSITGGTSRALTFYFRSDTSGTSYLFQNHLNTVCGASWPAPYNAPPYQGGGRSAVWGLGTSTSWLGKTSGNFIGASGNPGIIAGIQSTRGATGYIEGAYAKRATLSQAQLLNASGKFSDPSVAANVTAALQNVTSASITFGGGSDHINLGTVGDSRIDCILYIDPSVFANPTIGSAYPIVGVSYMLFYGNNNGVHTTDKRTLLNYMVSSTASSIMSSTEYAPLASSIHSLVSSATNGTGNYAGKACLQ